MSEYRSADQESYAKLIQSSLRPGAPLLAGAAAGLGKTHGYTIPLVKSGLKVAIAMSTRQLIDQFLESDALKAALAIKSVSVMALMTRRSFETDRAYREHKARALKADVLLITHMGAFIDTYSPNYANLRGRDVVLFDEADLLADAADLRSTFDISPETLKKLGVEDAQYQDAAQAVRQKSDDPEEKAAAGAILRALEKPAWYKVVGKEEDGALILKHRMPGRMLRTLVEEVPRCIFTSGTLQVAGSFDHFVKAIGLKAIAPESRHIDPKVHGALKVEVAADELSIEDQAMMINAAQRPTLVLTTSHKITLALGELCPDAVSRRPGEPLADAVSRCADDGILIAAGAWSGLDAPRLRWKTVVIPKTPYARPAVVDQVTVTRYVDSEVVAIRRTNQGLHRGLRTPDSKCTLLLLDPRSSRQSLRQAIPTRFKVAWESFEEGSKEIRDHTEMERTRNASLRKTALKARGAKCEEPNCAVTAEHQLDVHHLIPIAQGARKTTLEDVRVLCKNHHAEAHHRMREENLSKEND